MVRPDLRNIEQIEDMQREAYSDRIGTVYGDFEVVAIEYDWGRRKQHWTLRCQKCGSTRETWNGKDLIKGRTLGICKECLRKKAAEREECRKVIAAERAENAANNPKWLGRTFGCWEVVGYKGGGDWEVRCIHCGHVGVRRAKDVQEMTTPICWKCRDGRRGEHWDRLHTIWYGMRERCFGGDPERNKNYGGRGITICEEWDDFKVFYDWALAHGYAPGLTIDRKDVNGNYCPENCRWATVKEQCNNQRRTLWYEIDGEVKSLAQWCEKYGVDYGRTKGRLERGWDILDALTASKGMRVNPHGEKKRGKMYELNGESRPLSEWCAIFDIHRPTVEYRMKKKGMSLAEALTADKYS